MVNNTLVYQTSEGFDVYRYDSPSEGVSVHYVRYPNGDIYSQPSVHELESAIKAAEQWSNARARTFTRTV